MQEVQGAGHRRHRPDRAPRRPRVLAGRAARRLAPGLPRDRQRGPRGDRPAAADAAEGGARRRRPARDPAAGRDQALPRAVRARHGGPALRPRAGAGRDRRFRPAGRPRRRSHARQDAADGELEGHGGDRRRPADRRGAGRHDRAPPRDRVRPRHHHGGRDAARPVDRASAGRPLDPQQAAALRRRRDLAHLRDDDGRHGARDPAAAGARDARPARAGGLRGRRRAARRGLRDHAGGQPDDDAAGARDRSRAAVDGAVHHRLALAAAGHGPRLRRPGAQARARPRSSRPSAPTWAATSSPACWRRG